MPHGGHDLADLCLGRLQLLAIELDQGLHDWNSFLPSQLDVEIFFEPENDLLVEPIWENRYLLALARQSLPSYTMSFLD